MGSMTPPPGSQPFGETADIRFFWCGETRSAPLAQIEAAIAGGSVAVACAGAAGSGKTALLHKLADRLSSAGAGFIHPDRVVGCGARASVASARPAWEGSKEPVLASASVQVLLLDDVDQLSRAEMAQLREWWGAAREKCTHVALVVSCAASAVDPQSASRRQDLRSMIDDVVTLPPLAHADIEEMIGHRLEVAGRALEEVFTRSAIDKVAFYAKGTPKRLVEICNRAMSLAEESGDFPIDSDLVKEAAHQIYLPSHLREFSRKISMGLGPIPASLGGSGLDSSPQPAPPPVVETRYERRAYVEPRPSVEVGPPASLSAQVGAARLRDPEQDQRRTRPLDEEIAPRPSPAEDAVAHGPAVAEVGAAPAGVAPPFIPPLAKQRRRRGIASVVVICGIAAVTGVVGYLAGQGDIKPVEVVRIIPHLETVVPEDASGADSSPAMDDGPGAPSPAPQADESAPETDEPVPHVAEPAADVAEPQPSIPAPPPETASPKPEVAAPKPDGAEDMAPATRAEDDAALAVQAGNEGKAPSPLAADPATSEEDVQSGEQVAGATPADVGQPADVGEAAAPRDEIAELLSRPEIGGVAAENERAASDAAGNTTAPESEEDGTERQTTEPTPQSTQTTPADAAEQQVVAVDPGSGDSSRSAQGNTDLGDGASSPGETGEETGALPPEEEEQDPPVRWQFDRSVMRAQALLSQLRLYRGPVDGLFGNRTRDALREFQRSASLPATGELSPPVLAALEQRAVSVQPVPSTQEPAQPPRDAVVDAGESLQVLDIMSECRGKDAEWVYIASINRHVLCGGLSAQSPNRVPSR